MEMEQYFRIRKYIEGELTPEEIEDFLQDLKLDENLKDDFLFEVQLSQIGCVSDSCLDSRDLNTELGEFVKSTFKEWQEQKSLNDIRSALNATRKKRRNTFFCLCLFSTIVILSTVLQPSGKNVEIKTSSSIDSIRSKRLNSLATSNTNNELLKKHLFLLNRNQGLQYNLNKIALLHNELTRLNYEVQLNIIETSADQATTVKTLQAEVHKSTANIHGLLEGNNYDSLAFSKTKFPQEDSIYLISHKNTRSFDSDSFSDENKSNHVNVSLQSLLKTSLIYSDINSPVFFLTSQNNFIDKNLTATALNYLNWFKYDSITIVNHDSNYVFDLISKWIAKDSDSYFQLQNLINTNIVLNKTTEKELELIQLKEDITMLSSCSNQGYTNCLNNIACYYKDKGDYSTAVKYYEIALGLYEKSIH